MIPQPGSPVPARILDPLRAEWYSRQGLETICPTRVAVEMLVDRLRSDGSTGNEA
ncbi:MAG: hypothetical protein JJE10_11540 [Thermoleophilia bacterium]|nr:hypothetical protein [Thermoleophilia bacterium]